MKKLALIMLFGALVCSWAMAQTGTVTGNTSYIPTTDVMGAHENGGRGCAGCHAPHSGGRGSGGTITGTGASNTYGAGNQGDTLLWGTDVSAIIAAGTLYFDTNFPVNLASASWSTNALMGGVATCLSCHDGNVSRGAMMTGISYEQAWGLLNFASTSLRNLAGGVGGTGTNPYPGITTYWSSTVTTPPAGYTPALYGSQPIPTLLGNDGGTPGDYNNDHPVGPMANLGAVLGGWLSNLTISFTTSPYSPNYVNGSIHVGLVNPSPYYNFAYSYGTPAINSTVGDGSGIPGNAYVVCTTCHNQHVQNVYAGPPPNYRGTTVLGQEATIFYVKGPYNPGAPYDPTHEPSTMRFCQQCHFAWSSEAYGATNIGTAY